MKNNKKIMLFLLTLGGLLIISGISYAFYNYIQFGNLKEVVSGQVYFNFQDTSEGIDLINGLPISATEARSMNDNTVSFSVTGRNTYKDPLYYEIDLINGDVPEGKTESNRIKAKYLHFDLMEGDTLVLDDVSFSDFNNMRIYTKTINSGTMENITRNYTLRMWIDENLLISDTNYYADYTSAAFRNLFASVKVRVIGDYEVKRTPNLKRLGGNYEFWPSDISTSSVKSNITSVEFLRIGDTAGEGKILESDFNNRYEAATIKFDATDQGSSVMVWLEPDNDKYKMYIACDDVIVFPKDCSSMFYNFTNLQEIKFNDNIDTSNVTTMYMMFQNCQSLLEIDVSSFDTRNVTNMSYMFSYCYNLTSLDLSALDTPNLETMNGMINNCNNITEINMSGFNMSNVKSSFSDFFHYASSKLETLDLSNAIFPSLALESFFKNCTSLVNLNVTNADVSSVTNMTYGFYKCSSLEEIDLSTWDVSNVTSISSMFEYCTALQEIDLSAWDVSSITNYYGLFKDCSNLKRINLSGWDMHNSQNNSMMFYVQKLEYLNLSNTILPPNCSSLIYLNNYGIENDFEVIFTNADSSYVTSMSSMFSGSKITNLDLSGFDISHVTDFSYMFSSAYNLKSLNISGWDFTALGSNSINWSLPSGIESINASNVVFPENSSYLFSSKSSLKEIILMGADTSHVTDMCGMFSYCSSLTSLDLGNFDTSNVTNMGSMFSFCSNLKTIYVGSYWDTSSVTSGYSIFYGCTALVGGNGTIYDSSHIDVDYAHIDMPDNPGYLTSTLPGPFIINASANNNYGSVTGSGTYDKGADVTLQATPNSNGGFIGWYDGNELIGSNGTLTFKAFSDRNIEAHFGALATLTVQNGDSTMGTVSGGGGYVVGQMVTINATSNNGYKFTGWYNGSNLVSSKKSYTFEFTGAMTLTAHFDECTELMWTIETATGASYGFTKNANDYYESTNKGINNSAAVSVLTFEVPNNNTKITLHLINYGESSYDYGIVGNLDGTLDTSNSGDSIYKWKGNSSYLQLATEQLVTFENVSAGVHEIYVKYLKDGSVAANNDSLQFKVSFNDGEIVDAS